MTASMLFQKTTHMFRIAQCGSLQLAGIRGSVDSCERCGAMETKYVKVLIGDEEHFVCECCGYDMMTVGSPGDESC